VLEAAADLPVRGLILGSLLPPFYPSRVRCDFPLF